MLSDGSPFLSKMVSGRITSIDSVLRGFEFIVTEAMLQVACVLKNLDQCVAIHIR